MIFEKNCGSSKKDKIEDFCFSGKAGVEIDEENSCAMNLPSFQGGRGVRDADLKSEEVKVQGKTEDLDFSHPIGSGANEKSGAGLTEHFDPAKAGQAKLRMTLII